MNSDPKRRSGAAGFLFAVCFYFSALVPLQALAQDTTPPSFEVFLFQDPENTDELLVRVFASEPIDPINVTVIFRPRNQASLALEMIATTAARDVFEAIFKSPVGFGSIREIQISGEDLAGNVGMSDGEFVRLNENEMLNANKKGVRESLDKMGLTLLGLLMPNDQTQDQNIFRVQNLVGPSAAGTPVPEPTAVGPLPPRQGSSIDPIFKQLTSGVLAVELNIMADGDIRSDLEALGAIVKLSTPLRNDRTLVFADVPLETIIEVGQLINVISLTTTARAFLHLDKSKPFSQAGDGNVSAANADLDDDFTGRDVMIGVSDTGIDGLHSDLRFDDPQENTRIRFRYEVDETSPPLFAIGTEFFPGTQASMLDINLDSTNARDLHGHGTHVAATMASDGSAGSGAQTSNLPLLGMAREGELLSALWPLSSSFSFSLLSGFQTLRYLLARAADLNHPVVVNASWGSFYGPHDGSTQMEELVDLLMEDGFGTPIPGRAVFFSAGNDGRLDIHASGTAPVGAEDSFTIDPVDYELVYGAYINGYRNWDIFIDHARHVQLTLRILIDSASATPWIPVIVDLDPTLGAFFDSGDILVPPLIGGVVPETAGSFVRIGYVRDYEGNTRVSHIRISIANANFSVDQLDKNVGSAEWPVSLEAMDGAPVDYDVWSMDFAQFGSLNPTDEIALFPGLFVQDRLGDRRKLIGVPATAKSVITSAAGVGPRTTIELGSGTFDTTQSTGEKAVFSSKGPTRTGFTFDGFPLLKPDVTASGAILVSAQSSEGILSPLVGDPAHSSISGTSQASPHVAGLAALLFQVDPNLDHVQIRDIIRAGAGGAFDDGFGFGFINAQASLAIIRPLSAFTKTSQKLAGPGQNINYDITLRNLTLAPQGPFPFSTVLPPGTTFVSGSASAGESGGLVSQSLATLSGGTKSTQNLIINIDPSVKSVFLEDDFEDGFVFDEWISSNNSLYSILGGRLKALPVGTIAEGLRSIEVFSSTEGLALSWDFEFSSNDSAIGFESLLFGDFHAKVSTRIASNEIFLRYAGGPAGLNDTGISLGSFDFGKIYRVLLRVDGFRGFVAVEIKEKATGNLVARERYFDATKHGIVPSDALLRVKIANEGGSTDHFVDNVRVNRMIVIGTTAFGIKPDSLAITDLGSDLEFVKTATAPFPNNLAGSDDEIFFDLTVTNNELDLDIAQFQISDTLVPYVLGSNPGLGVFSPNLWESPSVPVALPAGASYSDTFSIIPNREPGIQMFDDFEDMTLFGPGTSKWDSEPGTIPATTRFTTFSVAGRSEALRINNFDNVAGEPVDRRIFPDRKFGSTTTIWEWEHIGSGSGSHNMRWSNHVLGSANSIFLIETVGTEQKIFFRLFPRQFLQLVTTLTLGDFHTPGQAYRYELTMDPPGASVSFLVEREVAGEFQPVVSFANSFGIRFTNATFEFAFSNLGVGAATLGTATLLDNIKVTENLFFDDFEDGVVFGTNFPPNSTRKWITGGLASITNVNNTPPCDATIPPLKYEVVDGQLVLNWANATSGAADISCQSGVADFDRTLISNARFPAFEGGNPTGAYKFEFVGKAEGNPVGRLTLSLDPGLFGVSDPYVLILVDGANIQFNFKRANGNLSQVIASTPAGIFSDLFRIILRVDINKGVVGYQLIDEAAGTIIEDMTFTNAFQVTSTDGLRIGFRNISFSSSADKVIIDNVMVNRIIVNQAVATSDGAIQKSNINIIDLADPPIMQGVESMIIESGILSPQADELVNGDVEIVGTISKHDASFAMEFGKGSSPSSWTSIASGEGMKFKQTLAVWNTVGLEPGDYTLRLTETQSSEVREYTQAVLVGEPEYELTLGSGFRGSGPGDFETPMDLALDAQGNLYVVDKENNRIQKFDSLDDLTAVFGQAGSRPGELNFPTNIAATSGGEVFIADPSTGRVEKFDSLGESVLSIEEASGISLVEPIAVAVDEDGEGVHVYVLDKGAHAVFRFDGQGKHEIVFNLDESINYVDIGVGSNGFLWLVNQTDGKLEHRTVLGTLLDDCDTPGTVSHIDIDSRGVIFVSDSEGNKIIKYGRYGNHLMTFGESGSGDGQFDRPQGVGIRGTDTIFVADSGTHRVQKFRIGSVPAVSEEEEEREGVPEEIIGDEPEGVTLSVTNVEASPTAFSWKRGETTTISYDLSMAATSVTVTIYDSSGNVKAVLIGSGNQGSNSVEWDGTSTGNQGANVGTYRVVVTAQAQGVETTGETSVRILPPGEAGNVKPGRPGRK